MTKFKIYLSRATEILFFAGSFVNLFLSFMEADKIMSLQYLTLALLGLVISNQISLERKYETKG